MNGPCCTALREHLRFARGLDCSVPGIEFARTRARRGAGAPFFGLRDVKDFSAHGCTGLADTKRASTENESL